MGQVECTSLNFEEKKDLLIVGGSGTLGRAIVNYVNEHKIFNKIYIMGRSEHAVREVASLVNNYRGVPICHDVRFPFPKLNYKNMLVVHAAAIKTVDAINNDEMIQTNVYGLQNILKKNPPKLLFISSDKACEATTLYGETKALGEKMAIDAGHRFVRYGNVVGSRGSVFWKWFRDVLLFKRGTITLHNPNATRFWMSRENAAALAMESLLGYGNSFVNYERAFFPKHHMFLATTMQNALNCLQAVLNVDAIIEETRPCNEKEHEVLYNERGIYVSSDSYSLVNKDEQVQSLLELLKGYYYSHGWAQ